MEKKPKLICIIGRTCSGKDTISYLLEIYRGIEHLVSYTTRPKRDYEDDGEEHWFITEEVYDEMYKPLDKLAYTEINGYKYFTLYNQLFDGKDIHSYVIDPTGFYVLKHMYGDRIDLKTIYVYCPDEMREARYMNREKNVSVLFKDRDWAERKQFDNFEKDYKDQCDIIINTGNLDLVSLMY